MKQMDLNALGIQTGPFAVHSAHFVLKPFLSFSLSYWGAISYYPIGPITGKGEFTQLQNWMTQMESNALGIQTGPFAVPSAHFVLKLFQLLRFHTGKPFLITPELGQSN